MKEIPLTQGKVALVDDEDYPELSKFKWHAHKDHNTYYAGRASPGVNGKQHHIRMHAIIVRTPKGMHTDHINGNGLDNRRCNLRIVTTRGNGQNRHCPKTSKYPGVSWHKRDRKWQAEIQIGGKHRSLGYFDIESEAATAYRVACVSMIGTDPLKAGV